MTEDNLGTAPLRLKEFSVTIRELLTRNRSYRRFHQDRPLDEKTLSDLVGLTCLCPSAAKV